MPMYHIMLPTSVDTAPISAFKNIIALAFLFVTRTAKGTGIPALLLGTLAQLVSLWYFDMITAFITK